MGKMSRDKGKRFERAIALKFQDYGYDAHRSAQCKGNTGQAADVEGPPGIHIEAKAQERMSLYEWMAQSVRDTEASETGDFPVVIHKQNNRDILVTMRFDDWIQLYKEWEASNG